MFRKLFIAAAFTVGTSASVVIGFGAETAAFAQLDHGGRILGCPRSLDASLESLVCNCSYEAAATGGVWGSQVYTYDSSLCRAALHDGVIGPGGGVVEVHATHGLPGYEAATRNGVASNSWGPYHRSIEFRRRSDGYEPGK